MFRPTLLRYGRLMPAFDFDRFTEYDDINWFGKTVSRICREDIGDEVVEMVEAVHHFVDFLRYLVC